jgi:UDP-3-O-[3-hydroxymyristoyl] glucosamine N-acyltransferase
MVHIPPISTVKLKQAVAATSVYGNGERTLTELGEPLEVGPGGVAFLISEMFLNDIPHTKASALVVQSKLAKKVLERLPATVGICIECDDAYLGLANFTKIIRDMDPTLDWQLGGSADIPVHPSASIDPTVRLGAGVIVSERASIGAGSTVLGNAVIGPEVRIGRDCVIFPGVVIYPRTTVGDRVRVHANAVLGSDGFGYARISQGSVKIWHIGKLVIGDDVEIGPGTMIDRGTIKDTIIENGVKIDNLVHIGHNGHVKAHATICAQVGTAGNVTIGYGAIVGGKVGVADKLEIGDHAMVGPLSGVARDVKPGEQVMGGLRAIPVREWRRLLILVEQLPDLYHRVKTLEGLRDQAPTKDALQKTEFSGKRK